MVRLRPVLEPAPSLTARQAQVAAFNAAHPVGSPILVWVGRARDGQPFASEVAAPARCGGRTGPMVLARDHGWVALSHVFQPGACPGRQELFLDASCIEAESAPLRLDPAAVEALQVAGAARGLPASVLARRIVEATARDGLIDAVLDDGVPNRANRRVRRAELPLPAYLQEGHP
ncbi:hypothetical protein [Methylobacterium brachiatum]|uniref:hypothetical protein n=1 Tax=Methylobacterium brachiatum TaxID=269660 RepID=UPI0024483FF0|nr:hypothetical protein [Methylobacterium brachiatum]MDH2313093.1 hypothetical protein [Methylobacterium brachiatum]